MTPEALLAGELRVVGRIHGASNQTFFAEAGEHRVVYKPISGERPLWDFPDGHLAHRELAAYDVDRVLGWGLVPPTVLRDGPAGAGMVQLWCDEDAGIEPVTVVDAADVPAGFRRSFAAEGMDGAALTVVHEDSAALRRIALFDVIVNNTDRKAGHVLASSDGRRWAIDHGICFHHQPKLRTVLWGWAGSTLTEDEVNDLATLQHFLVGVGEGPAGSPVRQWLTDTDFEALMARVRGLRRAGCFPTPAGEWPAIPWPPF